MVWSAFPKKQLVLIAVVHHKFIITQLQAVVIVFNDEAWKKVVVYYIWYLLIVELQKVRKRFCQKQAGEWDVSDLGWNKWREIFALFSIGYWLLSFLQHNCIIGLFFLLFVLRRASFIVSLVFFTVVHPLSQF